MERVLYQRVEGEGAIPSDQNSQRLQNYLKSSDQLEHVLLGGTRCQDGSILLTHLSTPDPSSIYGAVSTSRHSERQSFLFAFL